LYRKALGGSRSAWLSRRGGLVRARGGPVPGLCGVSGYPARRPPSGPAQTFGPVWKGHRHAWAVLAYRTTSRPSGEAARRVTRRRSRGQSRPGVPCLHLGGGAAGGLPRIHQAQKGADILAVAPPALEVLPPAAHDDDHDPSPRVESEPDAPVPW